MFCWKCGAENPEDAKFCKKCGATFEKAPEKNGSNPEREDAVGQFLGKKIVQLKNVFANKKKIIIVSAAIVAVVIVVIAGVSSSTKKGSRADIKRAMSSEVGTNTASAESGNNVKNEGASENTMNKEVSTSSESIENVKNTASAATAKKPMVGDVIKFGSYEQNKISSGKEAIEWIVLGERDGNTLLLSKYALDCKKYYGKKVDITWNSSSLRTWLNEDFYNTAFSDSEKKRIVTAHNENPDTYELYKIFNNSSHTFGAEGGKATDDKVFLLSWTEARDYLGGKVNDSSLGASNYNQKLLCKPTAYAKEQGVKTYTNSKNNYPSDTDGCCEWWLRSPGDDPTNATIVYQYGALSSCDVFYGYDVGVRPAILINSENDNGNNTQSSTEKTQSNNKDSTNQVNWLHRDPAYDLFGDTNAR